MLERAGPWPARVGHVSLHIPELDPAQVTPVVYRNGRKVASQVLWGAAGQPLQVLFDTSAGEGDYEVYVLEGPPTDAEAWEPEAGVFLETRAFAGGTVPNRERALAAWRDSGPVQGRSVVENVFLANNPHGKPTGFVSLFRGVFPVTEEGEYAFATVSSDASFISVDGAVVAQWPGRHGPWGGRRGEKHGTVKLGPGLHRVEYLHVPQEVPAMAVLAWKPPGQERFSVMPATAFMPLARFKVRALQKAGKNEAPGYVWEAQAHNASGGHVFVHMRFTATGVKGSQTCEWTFDDGTTERGQTVTHIFFRGGVRTVKLAVKEGEREVDEVAGAVAVQPNWAQGDGWVDELLPAEQEALSSRDPAKLAAGDVIAALAWAAAAGELPLAERYVGPACARLGEAEPVDWAGMITAARVFGSARVGKEHAALGLVRAVADQPRPELAVVARAKLELARLVMRTPGKPPRELEELRVLDERLLEEDVKRLRKLLLADGELAAGRVDAARAAYRAVPVIGPANAEVFRMRAAFQAARQALQAKDAVAATEALEDLFWKVPNARASAEAAILASQAWLACAKPVVARWWLTVAERLAMAPADWGEWYLAAIALEVNAGKREQAREYCRRLLADCPGSEAAMIARDRWPEFFR